MSYTHRHRYKSRREKNQRSSRNLRITFIIVMLGLIVYFIMKRETIIGYLKTYTY
jgi:hypothetical protein